MTSASANAGGKILLKVEKRTINLVESIEADYLLIASGSSKQVCLTNVAFPILVEVYEFHDKSPLFLL